MIKNIIREPIKLRWNGQEFDIAPSETLDLEPIFDIHHKELFLVEDRFVKKYRDKIIYVDPNEIMVYETTVAGEDIVKPLSKKKKKE